MSTTEASRKKSGYHHNDLHGALQDVALDLTAERGGPHFSLRELGAALGVSHAAVYRHFADKAALLDALTVRGFAALQASQKQECEKAPPDPLGQLYALNEAYIRFAEDRPGSFALMFGHGSEKARPSGDGGNAAALGSLIAAIRACQEAGIIISGDPQKMAFYMVMAPHGYACFSSRDRAFVVAGADRLSPRQLAEIGLVPLLVNPPTPGQIAERYFAFDKD